jgi:DNA-binding beta-propeller fold protein YncE
VEKPGLLGGTGSLASATGNTQAPPIWLPVVLERWSALWSPCLESLGFKVPQGITVLGSSGEVAVADRMNHRVQIFDSEGNYKRQFGTEGKEEDGQLYFPSGLASDAHGNLLVVDFTNRLQVFDPEGKHLCTRSDLGLQDDSGKGIAWSAGGEIAVADRKVHIVRVWSPA